MDEPKDDGRMKSTAIWVALLAILSGLPRDSSAQAAATVVQGERAQRLDRLLLQKADSGFNGSVLISLGGQIILHKGYGWADREHKVPVTTASPFWVASISKQFAAAAILKLAEQGRLSVQDPITRFFAAIPEDKRGITVHQLLTHTAGLEQRYAADGVTARESAIHAVLAAPLVSVPGERFEYSNDAFNLIAVIVEVAAGRPYEAYVREELLEPAGLTRTGFWGPLEHPEVAAILSAGPDSASMRPSWGFRGATGMFSTTGDLYRWYRALEENSVLSERSGRLLRSAQLPRQTVSIGYGWFISRTSRGTTSVWTRGFESFGHGAVLATYPDEGVVIVITSNSGERDRLPLSHRLAQELELLVLPAR